MKSWSSIVKTPTKNIKQNKLQNNNSLNLIINDYFKSAPNVMTIIEMIYYFRLICKNYNITLNLSHYLSRFLINYLQPKKQVFSNWIQKFKINNYSLYTSNGVIIRDKYFNENHNLGYDIVATWGLSTKTFDKYYRDKYFLVKNLSKNSINIIFFKNYNDDIWCNKLELDLSKWYMDSLFKFVNLSNNFADFKEKIIDLNNKLRLNTYTLDPKYNYIKLKQIYDIYKKIMSLGYDLNRGYYSNRF